MKATKIRVERVNKNCSTEAGTYLIIVGEKTANEEILVFVPDSIQPNGKEIGLDIIKTDIGITYIKVTARDYEEIYYACGTEKGKRIVVVEKGTLKICEIEGQNFFLATRENKTKTLYNDDGYELVTASNNEEIDIIKIDTELYIRKVDGIINKEEYYDLCGELEEGIVQYKL